jgi:hypothetical protein
VEDGAGEPMGALTPVQLDQDASAIRLIVNVGKQKKSFGESAKLGDGAEQGLGSASALDGAHELQGAEGSQF